MIFPPAFIQAVRSLASRVLLTGSPWRDTWPVVPRPPLPARRARWHALSALSDLISELDLSRPGNLVIGSDDRSGPPISFRVPRRSIYVEQPDANVDLLYPSIVFLPAEGTYDTYGLGPAGVEEDGEGEPRPALIRLGDWVEPLTLEAWGGKLGERSGVLGGVESILLGQEDSSALRIILPDYHSAVAIFELTGGMNIDDPDVVRGRRRAHLRIRLTVPILRRVGAYLMQPRPESVVR